jgi:hypothetical protein
MSEDVNLRRLSADCDRYLKDLRKVEKPAVPEFILSRKRFVDRRILFGIIFFLVDKMR